MTTIAMMIIGVPNGTVVGVLTGCGNLIPYVGPVIGYLTLALVCIPTGAWTKLIAGAIVLAILLFVDGNIINPRLLSSNVMVHPLLVVAALIGIATYVLASTIYNRPIGMVCSVALNLPRGQAPHVSFGSLAYLMDST